VFFIHSISKIRLVISDPPQFPSDDPPKPTKLEKDSLTLTWMTADVPKDSKPSDITYTIEAKEGAGDWKPIAEKVKDTSHKVKGVKPNEDVEFRVKAENEFGSSEPTKIAKVDKRAGMTGFCSDEKLSFDANKRLTHLAAGLHHLK
jgi:hypothetical protein